MNGVRRIWGGGRTSPSSTSPPPPPSSLPEAALLPSPPDTATTTSPEKQPWSPQPSRASSPPGDEPPTTTPGLVIRKGKTKQRTLPASPTVEEGLFPTSAISRKPVFNGGSNPIDPFIVGPSSRTPPPSSVPTSKSSDSACTRSSELVNIRDGLLMSLLTSEAVVDSRACEILSAEQVEELKKEHQVLKIRLPAMEKKLNLETKVRDAALTLSQVNAAHKKVSKHTEEQLEAAERKVAAVQKEYWRVSGRTSDVQRRLLEHCAGVLGYTVQEMEKKVNPFSDGSVECLGSSGMTSDCNPTFGSGASYATTSKTAFGGAHFFAGHAAAQMPRLPPSPSDIVALEANLHAVNLSLNAANTQNAEMAEELQQLRLEKEQFELVVDAERQRAGETAAALEKELPRFEELQAKHNELLKEQSIWEDQRMELVAREREVERLERRLEVLEQKNAEVAEMERMLADVRQGADTKVQQKEEEISALQAQLTEAQEKWEADKKLIEECQLSEVSALQEELKALPSSIATQVELSVVDMIHTVMQHHEVRYTHENTSLQGVLASLEVHLRHLSEALDDHRKARDEWEFARECLESELHARTEECRAASVELDALRQELEEAKRDAVDLASRIKVLNSPSVHNGPAIEYKGEVSDIVALLLPVWAMLPAPELRASKLNMRHHLRATSSASSPGGASKCGIPSLSDIDVRSLKAMYDAKSPQAAVGGNFSIEAFVARVQALVIDDRALIECLIRSARAHDMLKKNAERAENLAQESNARLETYQQHVTVLEDQNHALSAKQSALIREIEELQAVVERTEAEKRDVEIHAADQAETCKQLTEANNALSAKMLALAQEAASAPEAVRKQLEGQLSEYKAKLCQAEEDIHAMQSSEQTQRVALLDELNSMQTENANLRTQLRAMKR